MSGSRLPSEILDYIVDLLHDAQPALMNCCLVSKSWIPRTRKHLFAYIRFTTEGYLQTWKKTFPDPSTSPAHHTKTLFIACSHVVTAADAEVGGWVTGFSRVVHLHVGAHELSHLLDHGLVVNLVPFHGFSPAIKSLRVNCVALPSSQLRDLILSFPLLEDLAVIAYSGTSVDDGGSDGSLNVLQPPSSPALTGSLELWAGGGMRPIVRSLLSLPGGIHFRMLTLTWRHKEDFLSTTILVEECSHTLESLQITCCLLRTSFRRPLLYRKLTSVLVKSGPTSINLSKATRLKDMVFRVESRSIEWVTMTLQTITPEHRDLQQISICVPYYLTLFEVGANVRQTIGELICGHWLGLDHLLVQFWESRLIRPRVGCTDCIGSLLPEITRRGIMDLVE